MRQGSRQRLLLLAVPCSDTPGPRLCAAHQQLLGEADKQQSSQRLFSEMLSVSVPKACRDGSGQPPAGPHSFRSPIAAQDMVEPLVHLLSLGQLFFLV